MTVTKLLVDPVIEDARWSDAGLEALAEAAARATLADQGLDAAGFEISLLACDDARIAALNADFRGKPQPTNVLSWPSEERGAAADGARPDAPDPGDDDEPESLGDIAIAYDTCAAEAQAAGKPVADHTTHLIVHATLHLLGYDHIRDADATLMEATETRILAQMGLADPYADHHQ
ncbi:rRNA maturation RNase YbeY [Paracoccus sp. p3-h83]|uniref:rRNA maturation RNase YbeY n=1 Tax=Paracoccus sp. p3-h83 TaxID=3342805 RepID=UPI0035B9BAFB